MKSGLLVLFLCTGSRAAPRRNYIRSKDTKAFLEGSDSQQDLVAKGFILWKQECVSIFPQACSGAMLEEFKLLASPQHLATGDTFDEEITQLSHKAVIISHWPHFMQHPSFVVRKPGRREIFFPWDHLAVSVDIFDLQGWWW